ncbi:Gag-Pol polyprotein [Dictyocoela muelleri]|nr:Gag-Pol polyprotein [Dictyocoela muelleri]
MFKDTKLFVQNCLICKKFKKGDSNLQKFRNELHNPFQKLQIDVIGPLPKSLSSNRFIVMVIDTSTRWIEAKALRNKSSHLIATFILNNIILRYGAPHSIISDQGKEFTANIIKNICKIMNTRKSFTSSYNPKSNGSIERVNQTLIHKLSKLCNGRWDEWDEFLPYAIQATRISPRKSTKITPFELVFGFKPTGITETKDFINENKETDDALLDRLNYIRKILFEYEICQRNKEIDLVKLGKSVDDIEIGEIDLRYIPENLRVNKLDFKWEGPFQVISKNKKGNYKIKSIREEVFSVNRKTYKFC